MQTLQPGTERHKFSFGPEGRGSGAHAEAASGLTMFPHCEGSLVCRDLYPHVRLNDGTLPTLQRAVYVCVCVYY